MLRRCYAVYAAAVAAASDILLLLCRQRRFSIRHADVLRCLFIAGVAFAALFRRCLLPRARCHVAFTPRRRFSLIIFFSPRYFDIYFSCCFHCCESPPAYAAAMPAP